MNQNHETPKPLSPLTEEQIKEAKENLIPCLEALDKEGEKELSKELDRIYPNTSTSLFRKEPLKNFKGAVGFHFNNDPT